MQPHNWRNTPSLGQRFSLTEFYCNNNNLSILDLSFNSVLRKLYVTNNQLTYLNLKNGSNLELSCCNANCSCVYKFGIDGNENLGYICVDNATGMGPLSDEFTWVDFTLSEAGIIDCVVDDSCIDYSCGDAFFIGGQIGFQFGIVADDCSYNNDVAPKLKFTITGESTEFCFYTSDLGEYLMQMPEGEGQYSIVAQPDLNEIFSVSPSIINVNFPLDTSPFIEDFCLTSTVVFNDLEIVIIPVQEPVPGFDRDYRIIYRNVGSTSLSGMANLDFNVINDYVTYLASTPSENSIENNILTWNFNDLGPFEEREILATFNLNTPIDENFPLNGGELLSFEASINSEEIDETPDNNVFTLNQTVVNSFDPNDIRCLEGERILPEQVGDYVHYLIRFENVGTANATNILVKNTIDQTKFDISTLIPLNGSHEFSTRIDEGNEVEFIFDNVNLPFDDANNDGYVLYKIKTLESLGLGDTFSNQAEIFFDFNAPIITNEYVTEISEDELGISVFNTLQARIYPNPVNTILNIETSSNLESATVYDVNGRLVLKASFNSTNNQLDVRQLRTGMYFLTVSTSSGNETIKVVKR